MKDEYSGRKKTKAEVREYKNAVKMSAGTLESTIGKRKNGVFPQTTQQNFLRFLLIFQSKACILGVGNENSQ